MLIWILNLDAVLKVLFVVWIVLGLVAPSSMHFVDHSFVVGEATGYGSSVCFPFGFHGVLFFGEFEPPGLVKAPVPDTHVSQSWRPVLGLWREVVGSVQVWVEVANFL